MRAVVLIGLLSIATALDTGDRLRMTESKTFWGVVILGAIVMDVIEFINGLS